MTLLFLKHTQKNEFKVLVEHWTLFGVGLSDKIVLRLSQRQTIEMKDRYGFMQNAKQTP